MKELLRSLQSRTALPPDLPGLRAALCAAGDPQSGLSAVHIAGTNGKGSTAAMLESVLRRAGYRTGLFTSPHIARYNERIRVDGREICDDALAALFGRAQRAEREAEARLNYFSLTTLLALLAFREAGCEVAVLEAGLGGRLDPTNVVERPLLAILTPIGMDHMALLGDTLSAIAEEKAGIIKPGCDVLSAPQQEEAMRSIRQACIQRGARLHIAPQVPYTVEEGGVCLRRKAGGLPFIELPLGLSGAYQAENASLVVAAAELLRGKGLRIEERALREGLLRARWPGRFELLPGGPEGKLRSKLLLDGAHNVAGAQALARSLRQAYPGRQFVFVMAFMKDKQYKACLRALAPLARAMVAVPLDSPRALPAAALRREMREACADARAADSVEEGLAQAGFLAEEDAPVVVCGSLYLVSAAREWASGAADR